MSQGRELQDMSIDAGLGRGEAGAEPVLRATRLGLWALFTLAIANGAFLYLLPGLAATRYAWSIKPEINAGFMGAGYLAGLVAGGMAIFAAVRWRSFRALTPPFFALGVVMLAATVIHADRFAWHYPPTWGWAAVYALIPPAAAWLWVRQERIAGDLEPLDPLVARARWVAWPLGVALIVVGVVLLVAPEAVQPVWPWPITPLLARAFAAWHLLIGGILVCAALLARQPRELPIPFATVAAWSALVLLLAPLYRDTLRPGVWSFWPWLALLVAVLATSLWIAGRALIAVRAAGERM